MCSVEKEIPLREKALMVLREEMARLDVQAENLARRLGVDKAALPALADPSALPGELQVMAQAVGDQARRAGENRVASFAPALRAALAGGGRANIIRL